MFWESKTRSILDDSGTTCQKGGGGGWGLTGTDLEFDCQPSEKHAPSLLHHYNVEPSVREQPELITYLRWYPSEGLSLSKLFICIELTVLHCVEAN